MIHPDRKLMVDHLDSKLQKLQALKGVEVPTKGWIHAIRAALNMSLVQLAKRLKKNPVTVQEIERREQNRTVTLKKLIEVGEALNLQLVYGFLPKGVSIKAMIDKRAEEVARDIVMKTSHSMMLEDQENSEERLNQAIRDRADTLKREMPRYLWD